MYKLQEAKNHSHVRARAKLLGQKRKSTSRLLRALVFASANPSPQPPTFNEGCEPSCLLGSRLAKRNPRLVRWACGCEGCVRSACLADTRQRTDDKFIGNGTFPLFSVRSVSLSTHNSKHASIKSLDGILVFIMNSSLYYGHLGRNVCVPFPTPFERSHVSYQRDRHHPSRIQVI